MKRFFTTVMLTAGLLLGLGGTGCGPAASRLDDEKDPHYLRGRNLVTAQNYQGAVEEFEKALNVKPHNAAAHFELAWINEEQLKDYAAAIYHYEQHLKRKPASTYADRARERIRSCKMDLAKTEVLVPVTQGMQRDLERLAAENQALKLQLEELRAQLAARGIHVQPALATPAPGVRIVPGVAPAPAPNPATAPAPALAPAPAAKAVPPGRTHAIQKGETFGTIARQYNTGIKALIDANPGLDPTRLQIGQVINIPAQ